MLDGALKTKNKLSPCCGSAALRQLNPNFSKKLYQQDPKCTSKYNISYIDNNLSYTDNTCNVIIIYIIFSISFLFISYSGLDFENYQFHAACYFKPNLQKITLVYKQ